MTRNRKTVRRNTGPHDCANPDCPHKVEVAGRVCSGHCLTLRIMSFGGPVQ